MKIQLQPPGFDLRQVEDLVDEHEQVLAVGLDPLQEPQVGFFQVLLLVLQEDVGETDDRVERRAQLMAHVGEELALGPVGSLGVLLGRDEILLGSPPPSDVLAEDHDAR